MCYVFVAFEPCFSFSATFELAILLASCNALLHWFSTRHGASDLVRNFFFIYIICTVASGYSNASIWRYHFSYRLQGLHFLILFTLRPYLASGLALFFFSSWFGVGGTLCFVSFHFLASCSVESVKWRALHALVPSMLACPRALVPSCPNFRRALVPSMLACPRALVPACPNFQRALVPSLFACPRALVPKFLVPKFLACPRAIDVGVPSCPRARVPKFLACPRAFDAGVPSRLNFRRALMPSMLMFRTLLRDVTLEMFLESLKHSDPFFLNFIRET